ncbi:MAG TPA: efflux RND transporter periplasmic adaptor subunit [Burkholderiaceae bacterium]|nr:efflux RND transporter periplasmic adaptor subunit [Burkholderiaceae bacterium]
MKTIQQSKHIKLLALTAALAFAFGGVACSGKDDAAAKPADASAAANIKNDMAKPAEKSDKAAPAPKAALTVTTVQPSNSSLALKLPANGNVTAWQEASVGAEANGLRLTQVLVNVGDTVKKGQLLATFAGESVQADMAQAKAALMEAQANAIDAAANAERARTLQNTGALSAQQINQFITGEKTAAARVEAAQAMLNAQSVRTQNTQVRAPDNGVISARGATVGAVVGAGSELFRMIRGGRLEWRAEVTSTEVGNIKPGSKVSITSASGAQVQGTVRTIAPTVDAATRNALVYVDLPAHPGVKAGMFAKGEFAMGTANALTLPYPALVLRDGFTYAMRVDANNKVSQVKIETGRRMGELVEIKQGAKLGEKFVSSGAAFLADGDVVKIVDAKTTEVKASEAKPTEVKPAETKAAPATAAGAK